MDINDAASKLGALAEPHRLAVYRQLVCAAPDGLCVSDIVASTELAQPTVSFHLKALASAGLVSRRKQGRQVFYAPDFAAMHGLMSHLMENCCEQQSCLDSLQQCCPPKAA
ncbi:helix-turn-helix transcriptional regulator [bacterium]|nr:helix-turn-helix transcriptional regulator [bacterium]